MTMCKSSLPRIRERDALQKLLPGSWRTARDLQPTTARILEGMLEKGWIESRVAREVEYKLTLEGRHAFATPLPI
jgi:hypothetical protein